MLHKQIVYQNQIYTFYEMVEGEDEEYASDLLRKIEKLIKN